MKNNFLAVKMLSDQKTKISYSRAFAFLFISYFLFFRAAASAFKWSCKPKANRKPKRNK